MKRIIILILCCLGIIAFFGYILLGKAIAQEITWHQPAQVTVAWNAVTTYENGGTIEADKTVLYNVYTRPYPTGVPVLLPENTGINGLQQTIAFATEGEYIVGITAVVYISESTLFVGESAKCWSDGVDLPGCIGAGGPFGIRHYRVMATPMGLRVIEIQ